jgi:hypothetical protein
VRIGVEDKKCGKTTKIYLEGEKIMARTKKERCPAKTKAGKRCKNTSNGRSKFCAAHKKR